MDGLESIKDFALWAKEHRIRVSRISVGGAEVELDDLDVQPSVNDKPQDWSPVIPEPSSLYEKFAKDMGLGGEVEMGDEA